MNKDDLTHILSLVADGALSVEKAKNRLKHFSVENIDFAQIDHHRSIRKGFPEVIFGQGKTAEQIIGIMEKMAENEDIILVTRIDKPKAKQVLSSFMDAQYFDDANGASTVAVCPVSRLENRSTSLSNLFFISATVDFCSNDVFNLLYFFSTFFLFIKPHFQFWIFYLSIKI